MTTTRRSFIASTALATAGGVAARTPLPRFTAPGEIKAFLLHLGHNMWCDWFPPDVDPKVVKAAIPPTAARRSRTPNCATRTTCGARPPTTSPQRG